jgi:hypothetical protein
MMAKNRNRRGEQPRTQDVPAGVVCLTKEQMAAALQVSVRTINGMMARGDIAYFKIRPRLVRFGVEEALKRMRERVLVRED